ncbi:MAG: zinc transporter substrate-binding protein [Verrucomicrobiales bacterium]|nr:zinc transporter substrate-binding protein [Verrucomicrobiales bacterium]
MKSKFFRALFALFITTFAVAAFSAHAAKVRVITTLTDLADFTREIGGDHVDVFSLATGIEDTHGVPMKPSFVPRMNRADLLINVGLGCEHAFLPALLEASKNPKIQYGEPGYVDCSVGIVPAEVPKSTDHSAGDVHPYGNPHYMLDPVRAKTALETIYNALIAKAPQYQADFTRNRNAYLTKLNAKIAEWKKQAEPLKGLAFVSYHEHWVYFADRFGMRYAGTIELKPGVDPTAHHIENTINMMKADKIPFVVREPQFPEKVPALIARQAGAALIKLPIMPGGVPHTETYIEMMDYIINAFVSAQQRSH